MLKNILIFLLILSSSLSALTYEETVCAFEEALENQNTSLYLLKQERENQRQKAIRASYHRRSLEK